MPGGMLFPNVATGFGLPRISAAAVPTVLIVGLVPEMVRGQERGLAMNLLKLFMTLRNQDGLKLVEPLWDDDLPAWEPEKWQVGMKSLLGGRLRQQMAEEDVVENRLRLKLSFPSGADGQALEKKIESVKGVEYAEVVGGAAEPSVRVIGKKEKEEMDLPKPGPFGMPPKAAPKEAHWAKQWLNRPSAWDKLELRNIAILDSGADTTHPSLEGAIDFTNQESGRDLSGHGTFVAGVIAGRAIKAVKKLGLDPNEVSDTIDGLLPKSRIWMRNVMDPVGVETNEGKIEYRVDPVRYSKVLQQIARAKEAKDGKSRLSEIQVLNLSLGSSNRSKTEESDIKRLLKAGVTIVAAAGNYGAEAEVLYPAAYPGVISVGALNYEGNSKWPNTNQVEAGKAEKGIDLWAPGEFIFSTIPLTQSAMKIRFSGWTSGTSMAAPHVTAVAAVLLSQGVDPKQLIERMTQKPKIGTSSFAILGL